MEFREQLTYPYLKPLRIFVVTIQVKMLADGRDVHALEVGGARDGSVGGSFGCFLAGLLEFTSCGITFAFNTIESLWGMLN